MSSLVKQWPSSPAAGRGLANVASQPADPIADPSIAWPDTRKRVALGTITIDRLGANTPEQDRGLAFSPDHVPAGIKLADPMLTFRARAYPIVPRADRARHQASSQEGPAMTSASAIITTPNDRTLRTERIFAASRERVWEAMTDPALVARWWGRGNRLTIERLELRRGGHWRFVEHTPDGVQHGFEGRYREVTPPRRIVQTFEWDGMPGHVVINETELEDLGDGRTRLIVLSLFSSREERDGMMQSGMEGGLNQSYRALDQVLDGTAPSPRAGVPGMVKKVAFTMYPIQDAARARKFYEETLGLAVGVAGGQGGMHWIEYDLPGGGCLALTNTTGAQPSAAAGGTIALEVADLPALVERLKSLGVAFKAEGIRGPHCRMAMCLDSEGNSLLLHELDAR